MLIVWYFSEQYNIINSVYILLHPHLHCFICCFQSEDIADSIISFAHIEEKFPQLIILDIPGQKKYCHKIGPVTKEEVKRIAQDFRDGRLSMVPLQQH